MIATPSPTPTPIRRVGIVAKSHLVQAGELLSDIARWLSARGVAAIFEERTASLAAAPSVPRRSRDDLPREVDLLLVLGGDGTLLATAGSIAKAGVEIPILGVNFGSLGFLTEITLDELYPSLEAAIAGTAPADERLMLQAVVTRDGSPVGDFLALNDVVITKGALSRIIDLSVTVDDQLVANFKADGLIVASPTGSTAYNLAAGGPILHPAVDALILTPIAPHTLTNRPIVLPATSSIGIQPSGDGTTEDLYVTFDGQTGLEMGSRDRVRIDRARMPIRIIRAARRTYFEVLRQKLRWTER